MKLFYIILCFALLVLAACSDNIFGSGEGGTDIRSLRLDAENAFRSGNYKKAFSLCSTIVAKDSTISFGYLGMAKARLWDSGVSPLEIFSHVKTDEENEIPFANEEPYVQNKYLQGMTGVKKALSLLYRRDTLTYLYELDKRSLEDKIWKDTVRFTITVENENGEKENIIVNLEERLKDFRNTYSGNYTGFPLSDREFRNEYFGSILFISTITKGLLEIFDINKNGCIAKSGKPGIDNPGTDQKKWTEWGCSNHALDLNIGLEKDENGNFTVNLNQVVNDLDLDDFYKTQVTNPDIALPIEINDLNNRLEDFTGDMSEIIELMDVLGLGREPAEEGGDWKQDINKYKDQTVFYKIGTHIDEDGDGCIDEDIMDGQDNDGDGLKDANARLASTDPNSPYYADDGLMGFHGMTGNPADDIPMRIYVSDIEQQRIIANNPDRTLFARLIPDEDGYVTVMAFTQLPGYWTSPYADLKLEIAQDTVCPPKYSLAQRVHLIGGCWPNYTEEKFRKYWLKRGLAREDERKRRTHPSCENY